MSEPSPDGAAGGCERDEAEWRMLLAAGGFEPVTMRDGPIEARWL